ncbi:MAG: dipeptidase [Xanthomonadales bacterium]|nr:dipeptidase [Xanthomonadales bacterium]
MRKMILKLCMPISFLILFGCHQTESIKPVNDHYSTWDIIEKTEAMAPKGLRGEFLLHIKNTGKQYSRIYLNTQEDYRDRRNITVALLPSFQEAFRAKYDTDIRSYYEDKTILVKGKAKRVKIWFTPGGKRSTKYYFQTHIEVSDLSQISIEKETSKNMTPTSKGKSGTSEQRLLTVKPSCAVSERNHNLAQEISQKYIIADLHVDVPYRLKEHYEDVTQATEKGDFDYPRAKSGGLDAPFMSIYIPAEIEAEGGDSTAVANGLIDDVEAIIKAAPDKFALAFSTNQLQENFAKGLISLPMGMENGSPIAGDLKNLKHFYSRGIRYITLSHSLSNHISDSSYDKNRPAQGLTDFGKELIVAMNEIGVMVDVSHISDQAFTDVIAISKVPVIASHSSARHFTPDFERNMSDEMIVELADKGGVIFINFGSHFVSQAAIQHWNDLEAAKAVFIEENNLKADSETAKQFEKKFYQDNPFPFATLDTVLDHFDHVVQLVGIDHVGIGSDYDGVGDSLPTGLKDVSTYPNLIEGLLNRGYSEADIEKILSGNLLRVWQQVEQYAAKH